MTQEEELKKEVWELRNKIEIGKPIVKQISYDFSDEYGDFYTFMTQSQKLKLSDGCDWFLFSSMDIEDTIKLILKQGIQEGRKEAIKIADKFEKLRLYRSKSCQLLLRRLKQTLQEKT